MTTNHPATKNTRTRTTVAASAALGGGLLLALGAPLAASAHVTGTPSSTAEGSYTVITFSVGHGCEGSPTTRLTFTMPEGVDRVTPTVNPNWTIEKVVEDLPEPKKDSHGANLVDRDAKVVYTAVTPLADGFRDTIELQVRLPEDAAGETLAFPVLQECEVGSTDWANLPTDDGSEPESPAPVVVVTAAEEGGDGHGGHGASASDEAGTVGDADASGDSDASAASSSDPLARWLGVGGLVVGAAGVVFALVTRRKTAA
ncbi:DUF1775 domain-containing protein [Agromyces protaetiae]|uniref:DUF1775 domain-containing protein n=1 Tax=Agromyces protaetiae TaxID=2509455 RepID=A0A4P6F9G2_9MICO|nr:YcnI family protein [Agromyces protaetiae]QAY72532.1 DUF1775 domain-containing protein [Agromyces protaetiae]